MLFKQIAKDQTDLIRHLKETELNESQPRLASIVAHVVQSGLIHSSSPISELTQDEIREIMVGDGM